MIRYLFDVPNAVTITGLAIIIIAIYFTVLGYSNIAVVLLIWTVMLDHIDGWLARRTTNRAKEFSLIGGGMDSATDMVSASIAPGIIAILASNGSILSLISSIMIAITACLRVGYFNNFGLTQEGRFYGVPLTYTVPMTALCFMINRIAPEIKVSDILPYVLVIMSVLHICPFGPPPIRGVGFLIFFIYALITSFILLTT